MSQNTVHRKQTIRSLLPEKCDQLLDVGCGLVNSSYTYADKAQDVTCLDWKPKLIPPIPPNVKLVTGNFIEIDLPTNYYDVIIASDVFEHVLLEEEGLFIEKCISLLNSGGYLIISVPHKGTFAWLDPYEIKPMLHRFLWNMNLYKNLHNGSCDIRKGHKHYLVEEIVEKFQQLKLVQVACWGYLFDPLLSWGSSLGKGNHSFLGYKWLENSCQKEFEQDYKDQSFNVALKFHKQ